MIEQAKFTYSSLGKAFEKQVKPIKDQEGKQIDVITNRNKRLAASTNITDSKNN